MQLLFRQFTEAMRDAEYRTTNRPPMSEVNRLAFNTLELPNSAWDGLRFNTSLLTPDSTDIVSKLIPNKDAIAGDLLQALLSCVEIRPAPCSHTELMLMQQYYHQIPRRMEIAPHYSPTEWEAMRQYLPSLRSEQPVSCNSEITLVGTERPIGMPMGSIRFGCKKWLLRTGMFSQSLAEETFSQIVQDRQVVRILIEKLNSGSVVLFGRDRHVDAINALYGFLVGAVCSR